MASIGHSILGDIRYGSENVNAKWRKRGIRRPLLHSYQVVFGNLLGELKSLSGMRIAAPLPEDMGELLRSRGWKPPV
jgi:23S rRNA pseudouridine955/2504/2580 synthase